MRLIVALVLILSAHAASADSFKYCSAVSSIASTVMEYRQEDTPMMLVFERLKIAELPEAKTQSIILSAYDVSSYNTANYRDRAVKQFANKIMKDCLRNTNDYILQ